jgi:hypothetical protein
MKAPLPSNESQRLKALERYKILDTEIEVRKLNRMTEGLVKPLNSKSSSLGEMISSRLEIYCFIYPCKKTLGLPMG